MALQSTKHGLPFPAYPTGVVNVAPSFVSYLMDAAGEKTAGVWTASAAKAIRKVHFRTNTVTTGDTVDVRVETVDNATDGNPTGTLLAASTNASLVIAGADDNVWKSVQLTADTPTLAVGDIFGLVVVNGSGGGVINIAGRVHVGLQFPYGLLFTSSWVKTAQYPIMVPEYSDGTFEPIFGYGDQGGPINTSTFGSGSATNRRGNIFSVPFPSRANGCWVWLDSDGNYTVKLYDSDGTTVLATTATAYATQRVVTVGALTFLPFTAPATLAASTNYRLVVEPSSASTVATYDFDVPVVGMLDMFPGGQACHASVYTSGSWVETTTRRGYLGVFLDAFADDTGGGGGGGGIPIIGGNIVRAA
jgi:hypothetical protein